MNRVYRHVVLRIGTVAAVLALLSGFVAAPAARAATSGTIAVTAEVASAFSLTLNDQTADFGTNLTSQTPASNSTDVIFPKIGTNAEYYLWRPSSSGFIAHVVSSTPWNTTLAATESTGTSSLLLQNQDLRLVGAGVSPSGGQFCGPQPNTAQIATFNDVNTQPSILPGSSNLASGSPTSGADIFGCLALRVTSNDTPGTFNSTLTISVTG